MNGPTLRQRIGAAWSVFRQGYPAAVRGSGGFQFSKAAPFLWPNFRDLKPQWQLVDYISYVREGFSLNSLVYSALAYKYRSVQQAPLRAYEGDPDHPEALPVDHPLARLVTRPNTSSSWAEFQGLADVYLNVAGNSYIMLDREGGVNGLPGGMYTLRPDRVFIVPEGRTLKGFLYVPEGKGIRDGTPILPADMIHVKLPNPADPLEGLGYGLSPMAPQARSIDVDNHITHFLKIFFEHGAMTNGLLKFQVPLDDDMLDRVRRRWQDIYGGYKNWDQIGVLDMGGDYQRVSMTFQEMGFAELDERNEARILGPFGVPPSLLATRLAMKTSTYNNREQDRRIFWEDTMVPELALFEVDYQYYLQTPSGAFVAFDTSKVPALRKDVPTLIQAWRGLVEYGVPKDTAAEVVGLDLGELPDGQVSYMPINLVPVGRMGAAPAPAGLLPDDGQDVTPPADDNVGAASATDENRKLLARAIAHVLQANGYPLLLPAPTVHKAGAYTPEQKTAHWKAVDANARSWEGKFATAARAQFEHQKRAILAMVNEGKRKALARKATIDWNTVEHDVNYYLAQAGPDAWRSAFVPLVQGVMTDQGKRWATELGMQFDVKNLFAQQWFDTYMLKFAQPINDTTKETLAGVFAQAQAEGWSVGAMQGNVTTLFEQWMAGGATAEDFDWYAERLPPYRTELIARTETMRASNAGTTQLFGEWGVQRKEWLATKDERTRDAHLAADGQVVTIDEAFLVGGEKMQYPGDPNASIGNFANCRCTVLPVMEGA